MRFLRDFKHCWGNRQKDKEQRTVQYYTVYLSVTTASQLLIGSVYYYCEIGEGAEKLKSVKYNAGQAGRASGRRTQGFSVKCDAGALGPTEDDTFSKWETTSAISPPARRPSLQTPQQTLLSCFFSLCCSFLSRLLCYKQVTQPEAIIIIIILHKTVTQTSSNKRSVCL